MSEAYRVSADTFHWRCPLSSERRKEIAAWVNGLPEREWLMLKDLIEDERRHAYDDAEPD